MKPDQLALFVERAVKVAKFESDFGNKRIDQDREKFGLCANKGNPEGI